LRHNVPNKLFQVYKTPKTTEQFNFPAKLHTMKLLTQAFNLEELSRLKNLFAQHGVLIHVANENTARNFSMMPWIGNYALFVVLEKQYSDAKMLLADKNHVVTSKVVLDAYEQHVEQNKAYVLGYILKYAVVGGIMLLSTMYAVVWLFYR
jgi:hypothetical protein